MTLGPVSPGIKTYFNYDSAGYLKSKRTGMSQNEWQQTYSFDHFNGNLKNRKYKLVGSQNEVSESFTYDNYDRLINYGLSGHDSVSYEPNGNILFKTDAGNYGYSGKNNAVTSLTNSPDTSRKFIENISYTSFNKPFEIKHGIDTILTFTYGCQNQRIKTVFSKNDSISITKYYSGLYEKIVYDSDSTEYSYFSSPYGIIAVDIKQGQSDTLYYIETDHLGSFTALINSATGKFSERSSFDAWGRRRNPDTWTYDSVPSNTLMERGFTGHEHLDEFGIINMNGRIYDPIVGRFLGVDPFVQLVDFSQSYNAYSYCLNNPLKYNDPSGYLFSGPNPYGAYVRAKMRGYEGNYRSFSEQYYEQYDEETGEEPTSMTFTWYSWMNYNYYDGNGVQVTSKKIQNKINLEMTSGSRITSNQNPSNYSSGNEASYYFLYRTRTVGSKVQFDLSIKRNFIKGTIPIDIVVSPINKNEILSTTIPLLGYNLTTNLDGSFLVGRDFSSGLDVQGNLILDFSFHWRDNNIYSLSLKFDKSLRDDFYKGLQNSPFGIYVINGAVNPVPIF